MARATKSSAATTNCCALGSDSHSSPTPHWATVGWLVEIAHAQMDTVCTCLHVPDATSFAESPSGVLLCFCACVRVWFSTTRASQVLGGLRGAGVDLSETGGHVALSPTSSFRVPPWPCGSLGERVCVVLRLGHVNANTTDATTGATALSSGREGPASTVYRCERRES